MAAASNGNGQGVFSSELKGAHDIRNAGAAGDCRRLPINHSVENGSGCVVVG
jgi:hypothetical protein